MKKKILYHYSENPLLSTQGNNARAKALLEYFKDRNFTVDFLGDAIYVNNDHINELKEMKLINNGFLLNNDQEFIKKKSFKIRKKIKSKIEERTFNRLRNNHQNDFNKVVRQNKYDVIIISYLFWSGLIEDNKYVNDCELIIDTHDFMTAQFSTIKNLDIGKLFVEELRSLSFFDKILVISMEEKYIYNQFLGDKVFLATHPLIANKKSDTEEYDIVYVASNNEHNIKSARWFFTKVYPFLSKTIKICVVGKINEHIEDYVNVKKLNYVEDLNYIYNISKIAICPMLSGTGVKIKVIEAMSYCLPIVCNERGVDGLLNKTKNGCLVTNDPFLFSEYINQLLSDESFYNEHSLNAMNYFNNNHEIKSVYEKLDLIFKDEKK